MHLLMNLKLVLLKIFFFIFYKCINACKYILNNKVMNNTKDHAHNIKIHIYFFHMFLNSHFHFIFYFLMSSLMLMMYYEKIVSVALSIYSIRNEIAREFETESRP